MVLLPSREAGVRRNAAIGSSPRVTGPDIWGGLHAGFSFSPPADWDNVGILLGDPKAPARRVLIALDATSAVVSACRAHRTDLLVTHHPVIHSPLKSIRTDHVASAAVHELIRMGVAVISAHTNADVAPGGVSHALARRIGLRGTRPLIPGEPSDACKVAVFVPPDRVDAVLAALSKAGGGRIGADTRGSFRGARAGALLSP